MAYTRLPESRYNYAVYHARARSIPWNISKKLFYKYIVKKCEYCEGKLPEVGIGLDRINNNKGYKKSNVLPCCALCNVVRGRRFTVDEMKKWGKVLKQIRRSRECHQTLLRV